VFYRYLLVSVFCAAAAEASALPALVWTSDPSTSGLYSASATDTGMSVGFDCEESSEGCYEVFSISRNFTVTSPGWFLLTSTIGDGADASNCLPYPGCVFSVQFMTNFSSNTYGGGADLSFAGSYSQALTGTLEPPYNYNDYTEAFGSYSYTKTQSVSIYLSVGIYNTLTANYTGSSTAQNAGETDLGFSDEISLVPEAAVPEPKSVMFLGIALLATLAKKRKDRWHVTCSRQ
jgi:hypothetical protein